MGYEMTGDFGYMGGWGMAFGGLMMVFWIGALIFLIMFLVKRFGGDSTDRSPRDAAAILKQRYASGEIDTSEYKERLQGLR